MNENKGALNGISVLDLSRVLAGPWSGQMLGDLGAEVIKVERAGVGDDARRYGMSALKDAEGKNTLESSFYLCCNRNKKSLTVDLSKPEGQELVRKLATDSDVLLENYKVGDLKRYGLDYDSLRTLNPRLIYCSVTGFGQTGPMAARPGYDGLFQAMGGMMAVTGLPDGEPGGGPLKTGPSLVDIMTGYNATIAILAAINHRHNTGQGQYIDLALLDCAVAMVSHITQDYLVSGVAPKRSGNAGNGGGPADLIPCKDGRVYLSAGTQQHWSRLCELMGKPELFADRRFDSNLKRGQNRRELIPIISEWSRTWASNDLVDALDRIAVPAARYNELPDVFEDAQVKHRGLKKTVPHSVSGSVQLIGSPLAYMSETPVRHLTAPPTLGQHTDAILQERLGLDTAEIARLRDAGVI
jgi:crotonobetainyl-CoA:carnitine CoA-transferase CaiB-like acyl-CoA transferase